MRYSRAAVSLAICLFACCGKCLNVSNGTTNAVLTVSNEWGAMSLGPGLSMYWPDGGSNWVSDGVGSPLMFGTGDHGQFDVCASASGLAVVNRDVRSTWPFWIGFGLTGFWGLTAAIYGWSKKAIAE